MADAQTQTARRGGGLSRLVLWLLVLGLLAAVWWLASERNLRRFSWRPDESVLVIAKGRFFPLGMANIAADDPRLGKVYGPIPIPQGAKVSEQEFDDQTALDRALFDRDHLEVVSSTLAARMTARPAIVVERLAPVERSYGVKRVSAPWTRISSLDRPSSSAAI